MDEEKMDIEDIVVSQEYIDGLKKQDEDRVLARKEAMRNYQRKWRMENKDKIKKSVQSRRHAILKQQQEYYALNKDRIAARRKELYQQNKDIIKHRRLQYYALNKNKELDRHRLYRENNKEKIKQHWLATRDAQLLRNRDWYNKNKDEYNSKRRAKWRDNNGTMEQRIRLTGASKEEIDKMWVEQGGVCRGCYKPLPDFMSSHLDHDPTTMKLCGFLHRNCNVGIGLFKHDPHTIRLLADYCEKTRYNGGDKNAGIRS